MLEVVLGSSAYGAHLIATQPIATGQLVQQISNYQLTRQPSYQSIQIGVDTHIDELGIMAYLNHSCRPNTVIDTTALAVYAIRLIAVGEELTFFYPSTEWEMDRPFICLCGAPQCLRLVAGAKHLSVDTLSRYFINRHIHELIQQTLMQRMTIEQAYSRP